MTRIIGMKKPEVVRCAIYTRKSTEEGLEQEFNTLDAQCEAGKCFIKSQSHECWEWTGVAYDDGGFSGGNIDRPALKRLIAEIQAGKIDCVVVYKVDRLSRSLLDFTKLMEIFEKHSVTFVSVTQLINTGTSIGKLMLNMLMSFAQFERELISERTRDKIAATVRKGVRCGGSPMLGYDISATGSRLSVNPGEATRVKAIFALYLEHQSLITVIRLLDERSWKNKSWTSRKKIQLGGKPFNRSSLFNLLTNVIFNGQLRHKSEIFPGQHEAIIDSDTFERVQKLLKRNGGNGGSLVRNKFGAILKGLLRCAVCDCSMSPTHSTKNGVKRFRYYKCLTASKRGVHACPSRSIPAPEIESFVVEQIKIIGRDPGLIREVLAQAQHQAHSQLVELGNEQRTLESNLRTWHADIRKLVANSEFGTDSTSTNQLADLNDRISHGERRANELSAQISTINANVIDEASIAASLAQFDAVWSALTLREQTRVLQILIERVEYDARSSKISITFHPLGLKSLSSELNTHSQEIVA